MKRYFHILLIAFAIGLCDYLVKSFAYNTLHPITQGWSWHITIALILVIITFFYLINSRFFFEQSILVSLLNIANEDMAFYVFASIRNGNLLYNDWFAFDSIYAYITAIVIINALIVLILKRKLL
jgi:hypothetical protein